MKIAHVLTTLELGGAQLSTLRLVKELQKNQAFDTTLIVGEDGPLSHELEGIQNLIRLPSLKRTFNPCRDLICLVQLYWIFKKNAFHIVHTHCSKPSILGRLAALLAPATLRVFHTYHGFGHDFFKNKIQQKIFFWVEKILNKLGTGVVFVCEENKNRAKKLKLLHPHNNPVIPDFLALEKFPRKLPKKRLLPISNPVIASVLSFKDQKNPLSLLALCGKIAEHYPEARFHLIGDGPLLSHCKRQSVLQNLKNVNFPGAVPNIAKHYASMDLFIGASRFEGLSMAQLECLYFQVPMVITRAGGIKDLMDHGKQGFFYSEGNLQEAFLFCDLILSGQFQQTPKTSHFFIPFATPQLLEKHAAIYTLPAPVHFS